MALASRRTSTVMVISLLLACGSLHRWVHAMRSSHADAYTPPVIPLSDLATTLGPYEALSDVPIESQVLRAAAVDSFVNRTYRNSASGTVLLVYVGYWGRENTGLGHGPDVCYPAVGWDEEGRSIAQIVYFIDDDRPSESADVALYRFSRMETEGIVHRAVGFTAVVDGAFLPSSREVFWHRPGSWDSDGRYLAHVQVVAQVTETSYSVPEAEVRAFLAVLLPEVVRHLPRNVARDNHDNMGTPDGA